MTQKYCDINQLRWRGGYDEECAFLKYETPTHFFISMVRCWSTPSIEISVRIDDVAATHLDVPGFAPFSIEADPDGLCVSIDGVGTIENHSEEVVAFSAGNMDIEDSHALYVVRRWLSMAKPPIRIRIGDLSLPISFDSTAFNALGNLVAKQRHFRNLIYENPFYVQAAT